MLTGAAKTAYQREYMRRRRAGQPKPEPKPKPKPAWQPSQLLVHQIKCWASMRAHRPWRLGKFGAEVIDGLEFDTDEEWMEACHRHRGITEARRQEKQQQKQDAARPEPTKPPPVIRCSFCGEPTSDPRIMIRNRGGSAHICETCVADAAEIIAAKRAGAEAATS